jgi:hypothetical protein
MKATKSGHQIYEQNCWNEYIKADNKEFKGYEYYISSCHILYIYEDGELVKSVELSTPKWTHDNWAQYYINQLIIKSTNL